jgi:spore coat-associated protein N
MKLLRRTPVLALALCALAIAWLSTTGLGGAANAMRLSAGNSGGVLELSNSRNGAAILTAANLKPGDTRTGAVTITNTGSLDAAVSLSKANLVDQPGPRGGALSGVLRLRVEDISSATPKLVYDGALGAMPKLALGEFAKKSAGRTYRFTLTFTRGPVPTTPASGDNRYEGSSTRVDFVWVAEKSNGNGPKK